MHLLITRPGDDGARLAEALRQLGHDPILEPLLTIRHLDGPPLDLAGVQAILATSANGVRAIVGRTNKRDLPLYAVGDATAREAKAALFSEVHSADGDVMALAALVRAKLDPAKGPLVHIAGTEVAGDLAGSLAGAGFTLRREVLYESEPANSLSPSAIAAIKEERIDVVMLYSPRTAATLSRLIRKARLVRDCRRIELLCLSSAVAEAAHDIPWAGTRLASEPTQEAMLALARDLTDPNSAATKPAVPTGAGRSVSGPAPKISPRPTHTARTVFATLAAILVLAGIAWATQSQWRPIAARYVPFLAVDDTMQARLDDVAKRLASLESQPRATASAADAGAALAAAQAERERLQARVEKLETTLESLRGTVAHGTESPDGAVARDALRQIGDRLNTVSSDTSVRLERLARQIETIEQTAQTREDAETIRQARIVFAIGRLRDAVLTTHPYRIEFAALKALAADDPGIGQALARLAPNADSGVPTAEVLRQRFRRMAGTIVAATREPVGDSWWDRSRARIVSAVNIRRIDDVEGASADAIVARAEQALERGDVKQAASELGTLPERAGALAKPWLADADAYLAASGALVDLQTLAFAELGAKRGN